MRRLVSQVVKPRGYTRGFVSHTPNLIFSGTTVRMWFRSIMATKIETRNVSSGAQAVLFEGCEIDENGHVNTATADEITKTWGITEQDARNQLTR